MEKVLLIDGNSLTYRAFYGSFYSSNQTLKNSKGIPVNAISILNRMISKAIKLYEPTHVFVAFDAGKRTNRHDKLETYKGGRSSTPQELITQFPLIKEMLDKMGIKRYELKGIEADDIIATLASRFSDNKVLVLSSDKDLWQLVGPNISIIVPQNGTKQDLIIEDSEFEMRYGYKPNQVIDMKGLVGDASDNLPGVRGIGEKGAIKLIEKFNTLENIYKNMDQHTDSIQNKLKESKEISFLCKELATLDHKVEVPFVFDDLKFEEKPSKELIIFFKNLEINSLVKKYENMEQVPEINNDKKIFSKLIL